MFSGMASFFVDELRISKDFYELEYKHIKRISKEKMKYNNFGFLVDYYLRCRVRGDMTAFDSESGKAMLDLIEKAVDIKESSDNPHRFFIKIDRKIVNPQKNELSVQKAAMEFRKYSEMISIHNNNSLVLINTRLENFFQRYFEWLVKMFPNKYLSEKAIKYSDLMKLDFEDMKSQLTIEAADQIMSQPIKEWFNILRKHKLNLDSLSQYILDCEELSCRRNIIIHNNGVVNRSYLSNVPNADSSMLGERIKTDEKYVRKAYEVAVIMVYGILYASLKLNKEEEKDEYLSFMFNSGFDHMLDSDWMVSKYLYSLLIQESDLDNINSVLAQINYWISCKNLGEFNEVKSDIENADYSAMSPAIRMAKAMLLDQFEEGLSLLEDAIAAQEIEPDFVATWPIFIKFRKSSYYEKFKQEYKEQLEQQAISEKDLSESESEKNEILAKADLKEEEQQN